MDKKEQIEILSAEYNIELNLAKLKIKNIESNNELTWALTGESFDSLINQITNNSLKFSYEQRKLICSHIIGKKMYCVMKSDMTEGDLDAFKDDSLDKLQNFHDIIDQYPFYEIQQEILEDKE